MNIFRRVELSKPPNITFAIGLCISFPGKSPVIANGINAKAVVKAVIKIGFSLSKQLPYVSIFALPVALIGVLTLRYQLPIGPIVLSMTLIPIVGLLVAKRPIWGAIPDMVFGAIDTGLLTVPALWGWYSFRGGWSNRSRCNWRCSY